MSSNNIINPKFCIYNDNTLIYWNTLKIHTLKYLIRNYILVQLTNKKFSSIKGPSSLTT